MKTNDAGLALIKQAEGLRLHAYPDPATGGDPWTVGFGHTGKDVHQGMVITEAEAEALLRHDLERFEKGVTKLVHVPISENAFSALVSFAFNLGLGNLEKSTLLKRVNAGDIQGAAEEFQHWTHAAGKVMPGLVKRRQEEKELFLA